ncbi:STAS/SEC14 domain-containing protein [Bacteroidota bacterium]
MSNSNYKIWWDDENEFARAWAKGIIDVEKAETLSKAIKEMPKKHENKVDRLFDMSEIDTPPSKARKILAQATSDPSSGKFAYVGASVFVRTAVNFITGASGKKNAKHFVNEEKALAWINEGEIK